MKNLESGEVQIINKTSKGIVKCILDVNTNIVYRIGDWVQYSESMKDFWKQSKKFRIKGFKKWYDIGKNKGVVYGIIPDDRDYSGYIEGNEYPVYQIQPFSPTIKVSKGVVLNKEDKKKITDFIEVLFKEKVDKLCQ